MTVAGAGVGVEEEWLPGRSLIYQRLGRDGPDGEVPAIAPGPSARGEFVSAARNGTEVGWQLALPPGDHGALPVVIVLHGRGRDHRDVFDKNYLGLDRFLADAVASGTPPFALAALDGANTYWHARASGDAAGMVIEEFLPLLARQGLNTQRTGLLGWSMGGYGALHIGGLLGADRVTAVGAMSPALWHDFSATTPGAFDNEDSFSDATVMGRQAVLDGVAVRIDCGQGDRFYSATRDYVAGFDDAPAGGFHLGDHDIGYWRRMAGPQLQFLGEALV